MRLLEEHGKSQERLSRPPRAAKLRQDEEWGATALCGDAANFRMKQRGATMIMGKVCNVCGIAVKFERNTAQ